MTAQNTALAPRMSETSPVKIPPEHENVISNQFQVVSCSWMLHSTVIGEYKGDLHNCTC